MDKIEIKLRLQVVRHHPGLQHRLMEPARPGRKNVSMLIGNGLAPFVVGQAWIHAQKYMFMTAIRSFAGIETDRTKIKDR